LTNQSRMLFILGLSIVSYVCALGLGYLWSRAMHYPFTLRQRQMWTYYVLFISGVSVLAPLTVAMGLWIMPKEWSFGVGLLLLALWMVTEVFIVRRMSRPGGRFNQDPGD
jgi:hypothetical protein